MIEAGRLRHRVVLQNPVETQDQDNGSVIVSWQDVATLWASIEPLSAREFVVAQAEDSKVTTRITIRYRSNINAKMRLYHAAKDQYYNIEGVLSDKDSGLEYITLPCSEGVRYIDGDMVVPDILEYPKITGVPEVGQVLTASNGVWANDPTGYAYQWYLNDLPVVSATAQTWLVAASINDIVTVGVVASNAAGDSEEAISDGVLITA